MRNAIIELLNKADERKLRLIYFHAKALIDKDAEVTPGYLNHRCRFEVERNRIEAYH